VLSPKSRKSSAAAAGAVALCVGLTTIWLLQGPSSSTFLSELELAATLLVGLAAIAGVVALVTARLGAGRDPASEAEFEEVVRRAERLARDGLAAEPDEPDFMELDPLRDDDFEELVRDALDDLPDLLRNALSHVAVVISDGGRRQRAYGLYQGDGATREETHDRIVIFRDTLRRDFGHDPELLRDQVTRTVRHELAHHVGFDELGVSRLDL
jgi:predicted Zn-dependent protease with MMP-like domain